MSQNRGEGGKFVERVTDSDVLRALHEQPDPIATARELADILDVSSETIRRHLTELHDKGQVDRKKVGSRAIVWWPVTDEEASESAPAAPLRNLVGILDKQAAAAARAQSQKWRDAFDEEILDSNADTGESERR